MSENHVQRIVQPLPAVDEAIGCWLWALEESRARTKRMIEDCDLAMLDTVPEGLANSIGTLLYHIALIEADYLSIDVLGRKTYLDPLPVLFPHPDRDESGRLCVVTGVSLPDHVSRLDAVRAKVLEVFVSMTATEFTTARVLPEYNYSISPAWTIHHLMQHEAEHRGEIGSLITLMRPQNIDR